MAAGLGVCFNRESTQGKGKCQQGVGSSVGCRRHWEIKSAGAAHRNVLRCFVKRFGALQR